MLKSTNVLKSVVHLYQQKQLEIMNTFNENNKLTLNDVVEGLLEGREFKFTFECFGDHYTEKIYSFIGLSKFIKEFDYSNIKIEEV